ncbi:polysaccharide deacetylase family protein [Bacillus benzoevorans]|uniref:Peptidoglycan/xylan/chitin deacetylase (PgdA/CDA1 family) n=1 Tax=Bacillus benzoevorans TaxID=1456 RepID=A0A7X0LV93_9BACI|nr:polysaccharide deacetylase family protein [Bacillus benzoevorans]MBB6445285.1 peptidoglycan/xylan/chitin deacetylase (PgdA/CDA1 family) [Bacillus benzoevorans]
MPAYLIITALLLFLIFLLAGTFRKTKKKWIFFSLSALSLLACIVLISVTDWSLSNFGFEADEKTESIVTEKEKVAKQKKPPVEEKEQNEDKPAGSPAPPPTEPVLPQQKEELTAPEPSDPSPAPSAKIAVPANGSVNYSVISGDTLWSIAERADVTISDIKRWNNLRSDIIYIGQVLKLYGKNNEPALPVDPEPAPEPQRPVTGPASMMISHGNLQQREIALTFDAGSDIAGIQILDILQKHHVKATFFLTGKWVEKFPEYAKRIVNEGHEIGNHSYSHPDAVQVSSSTFVEDIKKAEQIIKSTTGVSPAPYFRFPYGSYNQSALKAVSSAGYQYSIQWSLDTIDWQQPSADVIVSRIQTGASNGDIILMHIGGINTPSAVDQAIPLLQEQSYQLVTLSQVLN